MPAPVNPEERARRLLVGDRVRRTRELNGWTQADLGFHLGDVCRQTIDKIEDGRYRLTPDLVSAMEVALRQPPGTLTAPDTGLAAGAKVVHLTADAKATPCLLRSAEQIILRAAHERITEAAAAKRRRKFRSPLAFTATPPSQDEIENQAELVRVKWGLGDGPVADLTYSIERQSAIVVSVDSNRDAVVYSGRVDSHPVILWHAQPPVGIMELVDYRLRILRGMLMTLALGRGLAKTDASDRAAKLSRAVLLPKVAITDAFGSRCHQITATNVLTLASQYLIPISAALARIREAGVVDDERAEALRRALHGRQLDQSQERSRWKNLLPPCYSRPAIWGQEPGSRKLSPNRSVASEEKTAAKLCRKGPLRRKGNRLP